MKVRINAIEKYVDEVILELPEGMSNAEFKTIVAKVESTSKGMEEFTKTLVEKYEFKITSTNKKPAYHIEKKFKINYMEKQND